MGGALRLLWRIWYVAACLCVCAHARANAYARVSGACVSVPVHVLGRACVSKHVHVSVHNVDLRVFERACICSRVQCRLACVSVVMLV